MSHTTGYPDSAPAPERVLPRQIRKAPKKSVKAPHCPAVPTSTTPRWKETTFKKNVGNNTKNWCKAYEKNNTTSHLDRCWALPFGGICRLLRRELMRIPQPRAHVEGVSVQTLLFV